MSAIWYRVNSGGAIVPYEMIRETAKMVTIREPGYSGSWSVRKRTAYYQFYADEAEALEASVGILQNHEAELTRRTNRVIDLLITHQKRLRQLRNGEGA